VRPRGPARGAPALLLLTAACSGAPASLAPPPAEPAHVADELLATLATRFGPIRREPSFEALRPRLLRGALTPSRLHQDPTVWTASRGAERTLVVAGAPDPGGYLMGLRPDAPLPSRAADYRASIDLVAHGPGEYEWRVKDELAVGGVRGQGLSDCLTDLFRAAEQQSEARVREEIQRALPRASAAFGRLFRLDTLRLEPPLESEPQAAGTLATVVTRVVPDGIRGAYPRFASYLEKRTLPMRARVETDAVDGARYWEVEAKDDLLKLRLRVHRGDLTPLSGPVRPLPERLRVKSAVWVKSGPFRAGFHDLLADVRLTREAGEKGFTASFTHPPDWDLPFFVQPFLGGPLGRPFQGEGSLLRYAIVDGSPTLLVREYRLAVKENWLVRWLGGMTGGLVNEFRAGAEAEADRFYQECLTALREDVRELAEVRVLQYEASERD
jgi:hypothetical protein